jgi:hypothetical protein
MSSVQAVFPSAAVTGKVGSNVPRLWMQLCTSAFLVLSRAATGIAMGRPSPPRPNTVPVYKQDLEKGRTAGPGSHCYALQ